MIQLNLAKVLLLGDEATGYVRYEIYSKEGEDPAYPEKIIVYREDTIGEHGERVWLRTDDVVSLEHLGFQPGGGFQRAITYHMRPEGIWVQQWVNAASITRTTCMADVNQNQAQISCNPVYAGGEICCRDPDMLLSSVPLRERVVIRLINELRTFALLHRL